MSAVAVGKGIYLIDMGESKSEMQMLRAFLIERNAIIRAGYNAHFSIREISELTGLSASTIKRALHHEQH